LKVRLAEQLSELDARVEELKDQYQELVVLTRQRERELRQVIPPPTPPLPPVKNKN
jgi:hypothetical protein